MLEDFLIRVKNAAMARRKEVTIRASKKVLAVALALKKLGYLDDVKKDKVLLHRRLCLLVSQSAGIRKRLFSSETLSRTFMTCANVLVQSRLPAAAHGYSAGIPSIPVRSGDNSL